MGLFDRIRNVSEQRSQEFTAQAGTGTPSVHRTALTGLWGSALTTKGKNTSALRPTPSDATLTSAVAARAMDLLVTNSASRPLEVITAAGEPVDHYLESLFNKRPNPYQSALLFRQTIWSRLYHYGQAFVILDRGASRVDQPTTAVVHHGKVTVVLTEPSKFLPHGDVLAYKIGLGEDEIVLAPTEVLWLRFADPENPWGCRAPIAAALNAAGLAGAAREWQAGQLANGGQPAGIVYAGAYDNAEDFQMVRAEIDKALNGPSGAARMAIAGGPSKPEFIRTGFSAAEVGYLDTLNMAGEEIANALGVPLDLIGGQRTYQNLDAAWRIFWEGTVLARLDVVSSEIDRQLLPEDTLAARFSTADVTALREGRDAIAARITKAAETDLVTIDEARAALDLDPLPNGAGEQTLTAYRMGLTAPTTPAARSADTLDEIRTLEAPTEPQADLPRYQVRGVTPAHAIRSFDRLEALTMRTIKRMAAAQLREAEKRLDRNTRAADVAADASLVFNEVAWIERAYDYLLPTIAAAMEAGIEATQSALASDIVLDPFLIKASEERALVLATQVTGTTKKVIQDRLTAAAIADRLTVQEYRSILATTFEDLSTWRAETIARTEMVGGFNAGARAAAAESGVVAAREWLATGGPRTRETHAALNGYRTTSMADQYPNGLMFPGDPAGDPAETINCRCVEVYVTDLRPEGA